MRKNFPGIPAATFLVAVTVLAIAFGFSGCFKSDPTEKALSGVVGENAEGLVPEVVLTIKGGQKLPDGTYEFQTSDAITLEVSPNCPGYVRVWSIEGLVGHQLYPNDKQADRLIAPGEKLLVPDSSEIKLNMEPSKAPEHFCVLVFKDPVPTPSNLREGVFPVINVDSEEELVERGLRRRDMETGNPSKEAEYLARKIIPFRVVAGSGISGGRNSSRPKEPPESLADRAASLQGSIRRSRLSGSWGEAADLALELAIASPGLESLEPGNHMLVGQSVAEALELAGRFDEARRVRQRLVDRFETVYSRADDPRLKKLQHELQMTSELEEMAQDSARWEAWQAADQARQQSIETLQTTGGQNMEAVEVFLAQRLKAVGEDHHEMVDPLISIGIANVRYGKLDLAREYLTKALNVFQKHHGSEHPNVGIIHSYLGWNEFSGGHFDEALKQFNRGWNVWAAFRDELANTEIINDVSELVVGRSRTLERLGRSNEARADLATMLELYQKNASLTGRPIALNAAPVYHDLARLELRRGKWELALSYAEDSVAIALRDMPPQHPRVASMACLKARIQLQLGDSSALKDLAKQVGILQQFGPPDGNLRGQLQLLADQQILVGDYEAAAKSIGDAEQLSRQLNEWGKPISGQIFRSQGMLAICQGRPDDGLVLLQKARDLAVEEAGGREGIQVNNLDGDIAYALLCAGQTKEAAAAYDKVWQAGVRLLNERVDMLSDVEAMEFAGVVWRQLTEWLAMLDYRNSADVEKAREAVWHTRGLATRALTARRVPADMSDASRAEFDRLLQLRNQLVTLQYNPASQQDEQKQREVFTEIERIERELKAARVETGRFPLSSTVRFDELIDHLPEATAIVEFFESFEPRSGTETPGSRDNATRFYDALVTRRAGRKLKTSWIRLCRSGEANDVLNRWLSSLQPNTAGNEDLASARKLRQQVWDPLTPVLNECDHVVVIPHRQLARLPWCALPSETANQRVIDEFVVSTAGSGQELVYLLVQPEVAGEGFLAVGGVDFDSAGEAAFSSTGPSQNPVSRAPEISILSDGIKWPTLPDSLAEVQAIGELCESTVTSLTGTNATESKVRQQMPGKRFVHFATHGFFADEKFSSMFQVEPFSPTGIPFARRNPLLLSGIVLAGANRDAAANPAMVPYNDGLFTALECTDLSLENTELIVLSACDSGLGNVSGGDGIFGLQRALHIAGSRSVLASLWKVDDPSANLLMLRFYKNLWNRKMSKLEALCEAQRAMMRGELTGGKIPPVSAWAAWTLSGDFR